MLKRVLLISMSLLLSVGAVGSFAAIPSLANEPSIPDSESLAASTLEAASEKQHPYLMYENGDVASLKAKITSGNSKKAFDVIKATVSSCMERNFSVDSGSNGVVGRQLQYCVMYLSTYAMLTDNESYAYRAVEQAVSCANQGSVETYLAINDALCIADFGYAYALAYDTLYDYMTASERELIKTEMEEIGKWLYENSATVNTWGSQEENRKAWNWNAVTHGALGMIAMSLGSHPEWLTLAIDRACGYYQYSVDSTGAGMEGLHYIGYALNTLAPMNHAIYRLTDVELLDAYPAFQRMPYWSMYMTTPQGNSQAAINQGDSLGNYSAHYYVINRYGQADALWGWEHTYGLEGDGKFSVEYHGNGWSAPAIIFFEDQTLTPTPPTEKNNPLVSVYDKGLVIARDSWENDASMITFTCGRGYAGCWNHPDDNSFTFHARGESFIVDLGANYKDSSDHNVVLIDGNGMDYAGGPTMREGTIEEYTVLENGNIYIRGNNLTSYKNQDLRSSLRQVIYGGGDVPFVLVYDFMRKDAADHTYNINFYTPPTATILTSPDGDYAKIIGSNTGETCFVIPYSASGTTLSIGSSGSNPCLTSETKSTYLSQATLFIMSDNEEMPQVEWEWSSKGKTITVSITRTVNGQSETETYTIGLEELVSFTTTQKIETETTAPETTSEAVSTENAEAEMSTEANDTTTELAEPVVTETLTTEAQTESEVTETQDVEILTSPETDSESKTETETAVSSAETTPDYKRVGGCGSTVGMAATIPATALGAAIVFNKKKKKR